MVLVSVLNTYDLIQAFHGKTGGIGFGLGTLIMLINVVLLSAYTLGCHSSGTSPAASWSTSPSTRPDTGYGRRSRS